MAEKSDAQKIVDMIENIERLERENGMMKKALEVAVNALQRDSYQLREFAYGYCDECLKSLKKDESPRYVVINSEKYPGIAVNIFDKKHNRIYFNPTTKQDTWFGANISDARKLCVELNNQ